MPDIEAGHTVKVVQRIKEGGKERLQIFEGLVIKVNSGFGSDKTFTCRKVVSGVGVEKIFPLYSTNIDKIEVVKKAKVRRAKLWHMRDLTGKSARLKETYYATQDEVRTDKAGNFIVEEEVVEVAADEPVEVDAVEEAVVEIPDEVVEEVVAEEESPEEVAEAAEVEAEEPIQDSQDTPEEEKSSK